jgi:hypothetical protein
MAGKRAHCPQCRVSLSVPSALVESPVDAGDADTRESPVPGPTRSPWMSIVGIGAVGLAIVLVCGGTPALLFLLWRGGSASANQLAAQVVVDPAGINLPAGAPAQAVRVSNFAGVFLMDMQLTNKDLPFRNAAAGPNPNKVCKTFVIDLEAGRNYIIDLESQDFDAYLRLEQLNAGVIAEDDDSGGNLNSRIRFGPGQTASYVVTATSLGGGFGACRLIIRDARFSRPR